MKRKAQPILSADGQQALDRYRQVLQQLEDLSPVTIRTYLSDLRQFIAWSEDCWRDGPEERSFAPQAVAPSLLIHYPDYLQTTLSQNCQYLFPSGKTHCALTGQVLGHLVTKYATQAQVTDLSSYNLRHRFGYHMAEDVPLHRLAQIMGHDSLNTMMLYIRGTKQDLQQDVEKIAWI